MTSSHLVVTEIWWNTACKVKEAFSLKFKDFKDIILNAVDFTFATDETKVILKNRIKERFMELDHDSDATV